MSTTTDRRRPGPAAGACCGRLSLFAAAGARAVDPPFARFAATPNEGGCRRRHRPRQAPRDRRLPHRLDRPGPARRRPGAVGLRPVQRRILRHHRPVRHPGHRADAPAGGQPPGSVGAVRPAAAGAVPLRRHRVGLRRRARSLPVPAGRLRLAAALQRLAGRLRPGRPFRLGRQRLGRQLQRRRRPGRRRPLARREHPGRPLRRLRRLLLADPPKPAPPSTTTPAWAASTPCAAPTCSTSPASSAPRATATPTAGPSPSAP